MSFALPGARADDTGLITIAAHMLGLNAPDLLSALTVGHISAHGEVIRKEHTAKEAKSVCKAMAKGIYGRLFDYVVQAINKLLSYSLQVSKYMAYDFPINYLN